MAAPVYSVGTKDAAAALGVGVDVVRDLVTAGVLRTVPDLSTPKRLVIAVKELERITDLGVGARSLSSAS